MEIDKSQIEVISYPITKSVYVTAPAGYGKTHVMTERIKFLLKNSKIRPPNKLLALTFSNAAANEMKERVDTNISNSKQYLDIANFHTDRKSVV